MTVTMPKTISTPDYLLCTWRDIYNHCNQKDTEPRLLCSQPAVCPISEQPDCPFCDFTELTTWYLCDTENQIVVCEDLQPKQYSYRILATGFGKDWHVPYSKLSLSKKDLLLELLKAIVSHHLVTGKARDSIKIDFDHSFPDHAHLQACMSTYPPQGPPTHLSCAYQDSEGYCSHPDRTSKSCVDGTCFQGLTYPYFPQTKEAPR